MRKFSKKNIKVGILGGTFDPPHIGHLHISKIALKKLKLNKLIWVITKKNPLKKKPYLKIKTRIKLSKKITNKEKKIFVQCFDDKIKSINTFDMLNHIKRKQKRTKLYFLKIVEINSSSSIFFTPNSLNRSLRLLFSLVVKKPGST